MSEQRFVDDLKRSYAREIDLAADMKEAVRDVLDKHGRGDEGETTADRLALAMRSLGVATAFEVAERRMAEGWTRHPDEPHEYDGLDGPLLLDVIEQEFVAAFQAVAGRFEAVGRDDLRGALSHSEWEDDGDFGIEDPDEPDDDFADFFPAFSNKEFVDELAREMVWLSAHYIKARYGNEGKQGGEGLPEGLVVTFARREREAAPHMVELEMTGIEVDSRRSVSLLASSLQILTESAIGVLLSEVIDYLDLPEISARDLMTASGIVPYVMTQNAVQQGESADLLEHLKKVSEAASQELPRAARTLEEGDSTSRH